MITGVVGGGVGNGRGTNAGLVFHILLVCPLGQRLVVGRRPGAGPGAGPGARGRRPDGEHARRPDSKPWRRGAHGRAPPREKDTSHRLDVCGLCVQSLRAVLDKVTWKHYSPLLFSSTATAAPSPQGKSTKRLHPANLQPFWSSAPSLLPQPPCLSDGCPRHLSRLASCQFSIHGPSRRRLRCFEEIAKHPCSCRGSSKTGPLQLERRDGGASGFRVSVYGLGTVRDLGFRV